MVDVSTNPVPKLSRLEMHGFKSFATRTVLVFEPGITAVVGPNGSGKSNIADAVRWVLGETSYSALRSKKTEDVIFAGGKGKAQGGMAEVTVTFNNEDRWLPSEFSEVTVTRRAFRGGSTEYLINGRKVRLKDVARLTASLGHSYTVVGQGLVDAALSQRAEERRGLFEHAANLTGLRLRVQEGERNLAETDANVTRLSDLLAQIEPNLRRLERAARQQKEWKDLRDRQVFLQRGHYRRLLVQAQTRRTAAEADLSMARDQRDAARSALEALIAQRPVVEHALERATHARETHDARLTELRQQLREIIHRRELVEERISALDRRAQDADATRAALLEQIGTTTHRLETSTTALEVLRAETEQARTAAREMQRAAAQARSDRHRAEDELAALSRAALQQERRIADLQQQHALLLQRSETSATDSSRQQQEAKTRKERLQALTTELAEYEETEQRLQREIAAADEQLASLRAALESAQAQIESATAARARAESARAQAQHRLDALTRMHESGEGLYQGPRQVMAWHRAGQLSGVLGTLAELIRVEPQYDTALEIALGGHVQDIVVVAWKDAEAAISRLKEARAGRATFQPIETVRRRGGTRSVPAEIARATGVHGIASDLVHSDDDVAEVVGALLGRIVVVDDLATSRRLLNDLPSGWSTVTLAGEITRSGGSVTGGSQGRDAGVLSRERDLQDLPATVARLANAVKTAETTLRTHTDAADLLQQQRRELETQRAELVAQQRAVGPQRTRIATWIADVQAQQDSAARQQQAAEITAGERAETLRNLAAEIDAGRVSLVDLRDREAAVAAQSSAQRESSTESDEALATANAHAAALEERARAEERQVHQLQSQIRAQKTELANREQDEDEMRGRRAALAEELSRLETEHVALQQSVDASEAEGLPLSAALKSSAEQVRDLHSKIETARQATMEHERAFGQAELMVERARAEVWAIHQRIVDDLNLEDPDTLLPDTEDTDFTNLPEDHDETEREISRLRNRLHRVGYVSDTVVEDYEQEAERFAFMTEQLADVQQASTRLRTMLAELHETMQTRFEETFEQVSIAFSEAFTVLFGGGSARLVLAADDDGAPGGIDIVAQPPGKRLQGLALLSGGERSLTAVALLFAILRVNPSPFVLLDEVDAALDEANVVRFRDELRTLASETQAIVITHNRGTVESADTLYGITMGGDGVSQTLSLRLADLPMDGDYDVRDLPAVSAGVPIR